MALFAGTYENKVDKKGRVSLPAPFRAQLPEGDGRLVYVYRSPNLLALEACDQAFMERLAESLEQYDMFSDDEAGMGAVIMADARPLSLDGEGRIMIPAEYMDFANIEGHVAFAGYGRRFHLWEPARLRAHTVASRTRVKGQTFRLKPTEPRS
jgi:MraZ protein